MLPVNNIKGIDAEIALTDQQRALLSGFVKQEGFDIIQMIMENILRKYNYKLYATDPKDSNAVLVNHQAAHFIGAFYTELIARLKEEADLDYYNSRARFEDDAEVR